VFGGGEGSGMAPAMVSVLMWNMLAWFVWGLFILGLRFVVERKQQKIVAAEQQLALDATI